MINLTTNLARGIPKVVGDIYSIYLLQIIWVKSTCSKSYFSAHLSA